MVVPGVGPEPPKWALDIVPDLLVRLVHPPSGPIYQAPGAPGPWEQLRVRLSAPERYGKRDPGA